MSIIPDFSNQPEYLKSILTNTIMLPFWYISIYLFHPKLYATNDTLLIGALCICLTICSGLVSAYAVQNIERLNKSAILDQKVITAAITFQIAIFGILILICYLWKIIFDKIILFYGFVLIYFGVFTLLNFILKPEKSEEKKE